MFCTTVSECQKTRIGTEWLLMGSAINPFLPENRWRLISIRWKFQGSIYEWKPDNWKEKVWSEQATRSPLHICTEGLKFQKVLTVFQKIMKFLCFHWIYHVFAVYELFFPLFNGASVSILAQNCVLGLEISFFHRKSTKVPTNFIVYIKITLSWCSYGSQDGCKAF